MQLPNQFSALKDKNILLLVAGKQEAKLYRVRRDSVDEVSSVSVPRERYSDNEGLLQAAPNGRVVSGSIELRQDEVVIREFLRTLEPEFKKIGDDFDELYFFAPDTSRRQIREALPKSWQEKIASEEDGNLIKESPLAILERIIKQKERPFEPVTNEEKKIMSIPEQ